MQWNDRKTGREGSLGQCMSSLGTFNKRCHKALHTMGFDKQLQRQKKQSLQQSGLTGWERGMSVTEG